MLKNDFYEVVSKEIAEGRINSTIRFNAGHSIFTGHFPGQPVVPGVCMMMIIKELLAEHYGGSVLIRKAPQVKFLKMIVPELSPEADVFIQFSILNEQTWLADATIKKEATVFFKMKAQVELISSTKDQPGS